MLTYFAFYCAANNYEWLLIYPSSFYTFSDNYFSVIILYYVNFLLYIENWFYSLLISSYNSSPTNLSFLYSLKFSASILFLVFIRAGVPRYRYDYLTKLGWSKFTVFCLFIFIFEYIIFTLF